MAQLIVPLRPLGIGDLFDGAIRIFRQHFGRLLVLTLIAYVPIGVIGAFVGVFVNEALRAGREDVIPVVVLATLGGMPFYILAGDISFGATFFLIAEARFGRELTLGESFRQALRRFWRLLGLQLLVGLAVALMAVTIIGIPFAIYFGVAWSFAAHALLFEDVGVLRALGRSRELVRGHWWRTLGIALLFVLFLSALSFVIGLPLGALVALLALTDPDALQSTWYTVVSTLLNIVSSALTAPLMYSAWVLYYYDLRVRNEGLDLAVRADALAPSTDVPRPTAPP
jgi:hypothetical protein